MDLRQIEYFVRVAELGSFTRASVVLGIAQPALSRQVRLLEVELRQSLLLRHGRGATPPHHPAPGAPPPRGPRSRPRRAGRARAHRPAAEHPQGADGAADPRLSRAT